MYWMLLVTWDASQDVAVIMRWSSQEVSLTSKYDNTHHALPEPLLCLGQLRSLHIRFPSLTSIQGTVSKLTALQRLRIEGLQGSLSIEPGAFYILGHGVSAQLFRRWASLRMRLSGCACERHWTYLSFCAATCLHLRAMTPCLGLSQLIAVPGCKEVGRQQEGCQWRVGDP